MRFKRKNGKLTDYLINIRLGLKGPLNEVLLTSGALAFFCAAFPVRLGIAMTNMGLVWLIFGVTGSFGLAGLLAGTFAASEAINGPIIANLIDKFGQARILPWLLLGHGISISFLILMVVNNFPSWMFFLVAIFSGASTPQIGALSMARWTNLLRSTPKLLPSAFTLEAMSNELSFLAGPALSVILATSLSPIAGSICAALLIVIGGLIFSTLRQTEPKICNISVSKNNTETRTRLFNFGFCVILFITFSLGVFFGTMQLAISAFAQENQIAGFAGVLYSILSTAGLVGGVIYSRRKWQTSPSKQLGYLLGFMIISCIPVAMLNSPYWLGAMLIFPGIVIAPVIAVSSALVNVFVDRTIITTAFTWINSASLVGMSIAASLAGYIIDKFGVHAGFLIAIIILSAAWFLVLITQSKLSVTNQE